MMEEWFQVSGPLPARTDDPIAVVTSNVAIVNWFSLALTLLIKLPSFSEQASESPVVRLCLRYANAIKIITATEASNPSGIAPEPLTTCLRPLREEYCNKFSDICQFGGVLC
jgi:hypothetical protein